MHRHVHLKYLSLKQLSQVDGVQDCKYSRFEAYDDVAIVVGSILKSSHPAFRGVKNVDSTGFFPCSIVDHYVSASFWVSARKDQLLWDLLLVLLVNVGNAVWPLKSGEDSEVYCAYNMTGRVQVKPLKVNAGHNSTRLVENDHLYVIFKSCHEHFWE